MEEGVKAWHDGSVISVFQEMLFYELPRQYLLTYANL